MMGRRTRASQRSSAQAAARLKCLEHIRGIVNVLPAQHSQSYRGKE